MMKSRFNIALLYMLATFFLVGQWTPSHAHLNVQHDHDGEIHQHLAKAHAHLLVIAHTESSDVEYNQENVASVVSLDHDQSPVNGTIQDNFKNMFAVAVYLAPLMPVGATQLSEGSSTLPRTLPPHIIELRAPPQRS